MKNILVLLIVVFFLNNSFGQKIISGDYGYGLRLSYDNKTNKLTGYFENYTGWDEETQSPKFSCIFYIQGLVLGQKFNINTYYPTQKRDDIIEGTIEIIDSKTVNIKLLKEHGGCWNVQHFADNPEKFGLEKKENWVQIKYVDVDKAYFYKDKSSDKKMKTYLIRGDFICIEKIEKEWAFCTYFGKKITKGWLKIENLNNL